MDYLKAQFDRIQEQLKALSASQKMLTASLVAIMVITLMWWGRYAGQAEMEPLLNQPLTPADISQMTGSLQAKGVAYQVSGDKIMVPTDRKFEILADLGYARLLPQDTRTGFDDIVKNMSPFNPQPVTDMYMNHGKEVMLSQIIRRFPNVQAADVVIDPTTKRLIEGSISSSATINIQMRQGERPDKHLISAAADVVSGAQAGLTRDRIKVIVDGVSYNVAEKGSNPMADSSERIELQQAEERHYAGKISEQLAYIQGVLVSVTVKINTSSTSSDEHVVDIKNTGQKEIESDNHTEESVSNSSGGGEAGLLPNVGASLGESTGGGGGTSTTTTDEKTKFMVLPSYKEVKTVAPAGDSTVIGASVRVPRSYFVGVYKARNPSSSKDPDDAVLQPMVAAELPTIRDHVKACTGLASDDMVKVDMYTDIIPLFATAPAASASDPSMTSMLGGHTKEIALGVLAVASLFMVMMMVRKGTPAPAIVEMPRPRETPHLGGNEALVGEVSEGDQMLDGMELDEDHVKTQQMLDQVSTMVQENPDAAANLVKRWMNRA